MSEVPIQQSALQSILTSRFESYRLRNPTFSLRAFAKKAGLSPTSISLILSGQRGLSQKLTEKVSENLKFDPQERSEALSTCTNRRKKGAAVSQGYVQLSHDQYQLIADWKAFAILNLTNTLGFRSDVHLIAERLGVSEASVRETLERLRRLKMISVSANGEIKRTAQRFRTSEDVVNLSIRKSHQQTLDLAQRSLENDAVETRDFSTLTLAFDSSRMSDAKALIRKFEDDFACAIDSDQTNEVYRLAIQFFPLSKIKNKKEI